MIRQIVYYPFGYSFISIMKRIIIIFCRFRDIAAINIYRYVCMKRILNNCSLSRSDLRCAVSSTQVDQKNDAE